MVYLYAIWFNDEVVYIGRSKNPRARFSKHCNPSSTMKLSLLQEAIQQEGKEHFKLQVLVCGELQYLRELEKKAIIAFGTRVPNGFNNMLGDTCRILYPELSEKLSQKQLGEKNHMAKLNAENVAEIRKLASTGTTTKVIAARYGVTVPSINDVIHRRTWKHVE